jgi:hypothetical protein
MKNTTTERERLLQRLEASVPPARASWPQLAQAARHGGYSAREEARLVARLLRRDDGSLRAASVCRLLRKRRKLPREVWQAWQRCARRWQRWEWAYYDWRAGGNRTDRRHGGSRRDAKRAKAQRAARKRSRSTR